MCIRTYYEEENIKLIHGECLEVMGELINKGVKFDAIITDIPQQITQNDWDTIIPLEQMWKLLYKLRKDKQTPIVLFTNQPFTTDLISSNRKHFKYLKYWHKDRPSGFLNAKRQPLRDIEEIAVFYEKQCAYNRQMVEGKENHSIGKSKNLEVQSNNNNYGDFKPIESNNGNLKYPRQLMYYQRPHPPIHPTEKPVDLLEDLINTYTNEGDLILDFTCGSGTTLVASKSLHRKCIGIELEEKYCEITKNRLLEMA